MKKLLLTFSIIFFFNLNAYSQNKVINDNTIFKPFKCDQIKSEFIRNNYKNDCLFIQNIDNSYDVK